MDLPKAFFKEGRGLRQGDPLSPYLFIMIANLLGRMMANAEFVVPVQAFSPNGGDRSIAFIQFAVDSLFMVKAKVECVKNLRCILLIMETAMGLKVNWSKSTLSPVGVVLNARKLVEGLDCNLAPLSITYLGLPLGAKSSSMDIWNPVIERMGKKLSCWKGKYLSKCGKLVLLKSILASVPIYFYHFFKRLRLSSSNLRGFRGIFYGALVKMKGNPLGRMEGCVQPAIPWRFRHIKSLLISNRALLNKWL